MTCLKLSEENPLLILVKQLILTLLLALGVDLPEESRSGEDGLVGHLELIKEHNHNRRSLR